MISKLFRKVYRLIQKFVFFKYYNKKREIIRNSYLSDKIFKKIIGSLRNAEIRKSFFNNQLFAYSNKNEKEKIQYIQKKGVLMNTTRNEKGRYMSNKDRYILLLELRIMFLKL